MNLKQSISLLVLAVGIAVLIFAMYKKGELNQAKGEIKTGSTLFGDNAAGKAVTGIFEEKANSYDTTLLICQIAGIVLIVAGAGGAYFYRKKK